MRIPYRIVIALLGVLLAGGARARAAEVAPDHAPAMRALLALRGSLSGAPVERREAAWRRMEAEHPLEWDWILQDLGDQRNLFPGSTPPAEVEARMIEHVLQELGDRAGGLKDLLTALQAQNVPQDDRRWLTLYFKACDARRAERLRPLLAKYRQFVFARHFNMGGSHYAYVEGQSDAQAERHFVPGSALCVLEMDGATAKVRTLIDDPYGVIRNPDVSYDGRRILFAWKKSDRLDDYHLYEYDLGTGRTRQITHGLGFADYEGQYLPSGDIVFNSTRCVQIVDCWWTEVSNLYTCAADGRFLRRLSFDQVHTNFPTVTEDGRVLYTRWDYNDRGQIFPQSLFQMNSDGTQQTEFYGNNSWFPTTILQARQIPGTPKVVAVATGHHAMQAGKLIVIDPTRGRQENSGVTLVAPVRPTSAEHIDGYGQDGELFGYPYPVSETAFVVSYHPLGWADRSRHEWPHFGIYFMTIDGRRELLAADPGRSCNQAVPVAARAAGPVRPSLVDYRKKTGTYLIQDIYAGPGLKGVSRGSIKALRVVALEYRAAGVGSNGNGGVCGGALSSTPVSIDNGCWDVKVVLGQATVHEDGSAAFEVPARTPVYFQAIDARGHVAQTMRSWSMVQPGETASCVGCHEDKNAAPPPASYAWQALKAGVQKLEPFYGPARGFSFAREIQPILDAKCVGCHNDRTKLPPKPRGTRVPAVTSDKPVTAFSLLSDSVVDARAQRRWSESYVALTARGRPNRIVNWTPVQTAPPMLPPYFAGACKSDLITLLEAGHAGVKMTRPEMDKIACWIDLLVPFCGDYTEANAWSAQDMKKYEHYLEKRRAMEALEQRNIEQFIAWQAGAAARAAAPVTIELQDGARKRLARAESGETAELRVQDPSAQRVVITGAKYLVIRPDAPLPEALVYSPQGRVEYPLPSKVERRVYPPEAFVPGRQMISARVATPEEISDYRNLAANPLDIRGESTFFPHATSNSECRNEPDFAARNAIDTFTRNTRHGAWPNQSWGPDKLKDLWWKVDFGRPVQVERLTLHIRADFPHDNYWHTARLEFSDGSRETIRIQKTADPQTFAFRRRTTQWVKLTRLEQTEPLGWCAITEVEAFGRDPGAEPPAKALR